MVYNILAAGTERRPCRLRQSESSSHSAQTGHFLRVFLKGEMAPMGQWRGQISPELKGCRTTNSAAEVELQFGFGLLILDYVHHLQTGVFGSPLFGKSFKNH